MRYALVIFETDESRRQIQADRDAYREAWLRKTDGPSWKAGCRHLL